MTSEVYIRPGMYQQSRPNIVTVFMCLNVIKY